MGNPEDCPVCQDIPERRKTSAAFVPGHFGPGSAAKEERKLLLRKSCSPSICPEIVVESSLHVEKGVNRARRTLSHRHNTGKKNLQKEGKLAGSGKKRVIRLGLVYKKHNIITQQNHDFVNNRFI